MNKIYPVVPKECTLHWVASLKYGDIVNQWLFCHTLVHIMQATANSTVYFRSCIISCALQQLLIMRFQTDKEYTRFSAICNFQHRKRVMAWILDAYNLFLQNSQFDNYLRSASFQSNHCHEHLKDFYGPQGQTLSNIVNFFGFNYQFYSEKTNS